MCSIQYTYVLGILPRQTPRQKANYLVIFVMFGWGREATELRAGGGTGEIIRECDRPSPSEPVAYLKRKKYQGLSFLKSGYLLDYSLKALT